MAVDVHNEAATREKVRVFMTGDCDGLADLRGALERHLEIDFVGASPSLGEAAAALRGGHLAVVLHGTRSSTLPEAELAVDPRAHERTDHPPRLGRGVDAARGGARGRRRRRPAPAPDDRKPRLRHPQGEPFRPQRPRVIPGRRGRVVTVFSPKGGTGKTVIATNTAARWRSTRASAPSSSTSTCSSATPRSCSASSRRRRSTTWSSLRASSIPRSSPATSPGTAVRARHPPRAASARGRRAGHRDQARPAPRCRA